MNNIEVDARQVTSMFADLTSRQQRQVYRNALRKGAGILVGETKRQLRQTLGRAASSRNWWNGKTLISGIKANVDRNGEKAKVHIMGDFRLKFFEMGTRVRRTTGRYTASFGSPERTHHSPSRIEFSGRLHRNAGQNH